MALSLFLITCNSANAQLDKKMISLAVAGLQRWKPREDVSHDVRLELWMKVEQLFKLRELLRKCSTENRVCRAWIGFSGTWDHRRMFTRAHECMAVSRGNISPAGMRQAISFTAFPVSCRISDNIGSNLAQLVCSEIPQTQANPHECAYRGSERFRPFLLSRTARNSL